MKIKGVSCLFFILSMGCTQALALDFSYKSEMPTDNKPSEEYLKKRAGLDSKYWNVDTLTQDNVLAEKREEEMKQYNKKFENKNGIGLSYDWESKNLKSFQHMQQTSHLSNRRCYRATRQKLEKDFGNSYSYSDIADTCGSFH
ncbi:hypothetical protein L7750_10310 [Xenorhabdus bovienii]|uniref:Lipoprotein n=2 Tax=Xenorhabdus bovienii TaxID=40576 RepID=A0A077NFZ3_XENBV|nr:hypothetical protein [Xenorhabdus bovienii]MCG3463199.1 hypothetical protein [Xenorhabdus bovienii]MCG3470769.1 hypothetical protein [Xenorhabdus bovienii]CDG89394.1 hypothetical protein XBFFR1_2480025 [Xenorhabdus bovienii str. feltiae France]CDG93448.1 hypothetical protein XBFFL1_2530026 [Xenorhabdus bovienii str. feltiae Florida]CDG97303.1 hypothetical protein XBP1_2530004 [Xenorhabdus bovienii str. puntauvense]